MKTLLALLLLPSLAFGISVTNTPLLSGTNTWSGTNKFTKTIDANISGTAAVATSLVGGSISSTGIVSRIEAGSANTLVVTNGGVRIGKTGSTYSYILEILGSFYASTGITFDGTLTGPSSRWAMRGDGPISSFGLTGGSGQTEMTIYLGQSGRSSNILINTRSPGYSLPAGSPPAVVFLNYTNGPEDVIVSGTLTVTNGVILPQLPWIPTNSIPASDCVNLRTNILWFNVTNTVNGGGYMGAYSNNVEGRIYLVKPTVTVTAWP